MQRETITPLGPGLIRVRAPNPSPMTFTGTNTYLLGSDSAEIAIIDPGPALPAHREAILSALPAGARVAAIFVTHSHADHSPLARVLASDTGAPVYAAGDSDFGRNPMMRRLAAAGDLGGGEGVDRDFAPDRSLGDGETLLGGFGSVEVLLTPGHMGNHASFAWRGTLFSGDAVMGWSTSLISPPDGDLTAFMATLDRLGARSDRLYYPGHGEPVSAPQARVAELAAHRRAREAQILAQLQGRPGMTARALAEAIYTDTDPALLPAAARNVLAHLLHLSCTGRVSVQGPITQEARFTLL
jgi:glyoxylase-like metal-dependent hydrolase (beta-lactamase superfamily II)